MLAALVSLAAALALAGSAAADSVRAASSRNGGAAAPTPTWQWASVDVDGGQSPAATGAPLSIALDKTSTPHIFYTAAFELPHDYKYATLRDGKWAVETVDTYSEKYGTFSAATEIALDGGGNPHVLYTMEGVDPSPCPGCSACVSCSGPPPPCCAKDQDCCDGPQWGALFYAAKVGGKWVSHEVHRGYRLNMSDPRPMDCSLALDSAGRPHVSFYLAMPKMALVYATLGPGGWNKTEVASGGYFNRLTVVGSTPIIVFQSEEGCFCVRLWARLPNGTDVTTIVGEGPNTGEDAQGYGISTAVSADRKSLFVAFTRNVYTNESLRLVTVPLGAGGVPGDVPSASVGISDAGRASATSVSALHDAAQGPVIAHSYGTSDQGRFEVRTAQKAAPPLGGWVTTTVGATDIASGGLEGAAAVGVVCCDARGHPVLAYTRRTSMYVSYLSYATVHEKLDA